MFNKDNNIITLRGEKGNFIDVVLRKSNQVRRISIKVLITKKVELVVPQNTNINFAYKFLIEKEAWVRKQLNKMPAPILFDNFKSILIYGELHQIIFANNILEPIKIEKSTIFLSPPINKENMFKILSTFLKNIIKKDLEEYALKICPILKVKFGKIKVKDTKRQWGSCASNGNLSFSWRLVFAPRFIMEYLVVHELCHLIEKNHGPNFWQLVKIVYPNFRMAKFWLKKNGRTLHQYLV